MGLPEQGVLTGCGKEGDIENINTVNMDNLHNK